MATGPVPEAAMPTEDSRQDIDSQIGQVADCEFDFDGSKFVQIKLAADLFIKMPVSCSTTIGQLKQQIFELHGIAAEDLKLIHDGYLLDLDDYQLEQCGIHCNGDTIYLM